jgi:hypothetical protein
MSELEQILKQLDTLAKDMSEAKEDIASVKSALKYNGSGLIPAFVEHCKDDKEFRKSFYNFKKGVYVIFGILIGSGVLTLGVLKLVG